MPRYRWEVERERTVIEVCDVVAETEDDAIEQAKKWSTDWDATDEYKSAYSTSQKEMVGVTTCRECFEDVEKTAKRIEHPTPFYRLSSLPPDAYDRLRFLIRRDRLVVFTRLSDRRTMLGIVPPKNPSDSKPL